MNKVILKGTKESSTGRNIELINTRNNMKMSDKNLISRLNSGDSTNNKYYTIKHNKNGKEYVVSKPNGNVKNNLE